MNGLDDAAQWDEEVLHLVRGHGADAASLIGYVPTLEQARFAHCDTHAALDIARLRPPDGHAHPAPGDPGWYEPRPGSYRPFPPSATAGADRFFTEDEAFPWPTFTGLPHTGMQPAAEADLADWPSAALRILHENVVRFGWLSPGQPEADLRDWIRGHAAATQARWLAGADYPAAPGRPAMRPARAAGQAPHGKRMARGR